MKSSLRALMRLFLNFAAEQTLGVTKHPNPSGYSHLNARQNMAAIDRCKHCMLINNITHIEWEREIKRISEPNFRPHCRPMSINDQKLPLRDTCLATGHLVRNSTWATNINMLLVLG